ncbi:AsmA family protein, partial [Polymorphobacter multimanifer]
MTRRLAIRILAGFGGVALLLLVILAAFPWDRLRGPLERQLSEDFARPVRIGSMERVDSFSLSPRLLVRDVRVPQADWAGPGDLARIRELEIGFRLLPMLLGRLQATSVSIAGARLDFVRDAEGRESWSTGEGGDGTDLSFIERLEVSDSLIRYRDAKQDRAFTATLTATSERGIDLAGSGTIRGAPVRIVAHGDPLPMGGAVAPWPFHAEIEGEAIDMRLVGTMDRPLDVDHFSATMTGRGDDLKRLDAIIEAGLPGTQEVRMKADVRRDFPDWTIMGLVGSIGRSELAGEAVIRKRGERSIIEGRIEAAQLDFDDLASDEGLRRAAEKRERVGPRLIPDTAIDLKRLARTDIMLDFSVKRLLWPGPSPLQTMQGRFVLDRSRIVVKPLTIGLAEGRMNGEAVIDQRGPSGLAPEPMLTLAIDLDRASLFEFAPDAGVDGRLAARLRLAGPGGTVREAIGRSTGTVTIFARDGELPDRTASLLGQDIGRGITGSREKQAVLNCMILHMDVTDGDGRMRPMVIDTSRAVSRFSGRVGLADERLGLTMMGAPKQNSVLRLDAPVRISGTIKDPDVQLPEKARSAGNVLRMLGRAITGDQAPL